MSTRKSLLFVSDVFPYPLDRGQHVRIYNLLQACGCSFDVTYIGPQPPADVSRKEVERLCTNARYVDSSRPSWKLEFTRYLTTVRLSPGIPTIAKARYYGAYLDALSRVRPETFDLIWAERPHIARLCADFCSRTIVDLDDIEHIKIARSSKLEHGLGNRLKSFYQYSFFRYLELTWSKKFLATIVCSEQDRAYLTRNGCQNAMVVPNAPNWSDDGVEWKERVRSPSSPLRLVFLGNVESVPNADAIEFFVSEVLPVLRTEAPDVTLDVIGPGVSQVVRDRYAGKANFRGFVANLGASLLEYDLMIAPLRFGSGTKLKVLDAMAYGLPVVTSQVGAEGLSLSHKQDVWIADSIPEIVEGILSIKRDPSLANRLSANAQALVRRQFSWEAIQSQLDEWLRQLR